jgi:hypothetical protein
MNKRDKNKRQLIRVLMNAIVIAMRMRVRMRVRVSVGGSWQALRAQQQTDLKRKESLWRTMRN